jgi:hypothetical protein
MKRSLMALSTLGLGIGFAFAVPTAVVHAGPCCSPGLNPAALQACLAGEALGGTCAAAGLPGGQAPQAPAPASAPAAPALPPMRPASPPVAAPPVGPPAAQPPGVTPGHGEPAFCAGPIPPGSDSLCPVTGLTPGISH